MEEITILADPESESTLIRDSAGLDASHPVHTAGLSGEVLIAVAVPITVKLIQTLPSIIAELQKFRRRPSIVFRDVQVSDLSERNVKHLLALMERSLSKDSNSDAHPRGTNPAISPKVPDATQE